MPRAKKSHTARSKNPAQIPPTTKAVALPSTGYPPEIEEAIRRRAHELYEQRGREDGHDLEDWLEAEAEILRLEGEG